MQLSKKFWNDKYLSKNTGWDLGTVSPPLKNYIDQLNDKNVKILIPGGGNSYEAEYLHNLGFKYIYVVDFSETALLNITKRVPTFPSEHLLLQNFFDLDTSFDLIIEQTFFCAINPSLRSDYAQQMNKLLFPKGKLVGVLFKVPLFENQPPFGGTKEEYINYFAPYFNIEILDDCYNSTEGRLGKELFLKLVKA